MSFALKNITSDLRSGIFTILDGHVTYSSVTYPVYDTIPKNAKNSYVAIGQIVQFDDGTKEDFMYNGTIELRVVVNSPFRIPTTKADGILNVVRGLLKPDRETVFTVGTSTLVILTPGTYTEDIKEKENGITQHNLIDIYNFVIN
jgi:hypothetical protein